MTIKVSIDASGGDNGIPVTIAAGIKALGELDDLQIIFVGDQDSINSELANNSLAEKFNSRYSVIHASEVVTMNEPPSIALRKKNKASFMK